MKLSFKFRILLIQIVLFSFVYLFLPENHFSGINKLEDMLKEKLLKKKIEQNIETYTVKETVDEIEKDVDKEVEQIIERDKTNQSWIDKFFIRLYFSCTTCASLGYGDVTPKSKTSRSLAMLQMISTFYIFFM